jgi:hypothetical protein
MPRPGRKAWSDNEPHVCAFWLEFTMPAPYESGAWTLVGWPPTGDGSTVAAGAYDTSGDGTDASSVIDVAAGHYRVEWAASGETVTKKKTFWVDASCDASSASGDESTPEAPAGSADESPAESSSISESPNESPAESAIESPADESTAESVVSPPAPTDDESPADAPPADEPPADESSADESPSLESPAESGDQDVLSGSGSGSGDESTAEEPVAPADEPADQPADQPAGDPAGGSSADEQAQSDGPAANDPGNPPAQDQLGGHGVSGGSDMADTASATHPVPTGLPATLGLLFLIVLQASLRRTRRPEVA